MRHSTRLCCLLAATLTGCAITPDYQPPAVQPATLEGVQSAALFSTDTPVGNWWSTFDDPRLAALVDDALAANLDIRIALARLQQSRAAFTEQQLAQFPRITTDASVTRSTLDNLQDTQRLTQMRWELGAGSELDVQSSRTRLSADDALAQTQAQVNVNAVAIYKALGGNAVASSDSSFPAKPQEHAP